MRKERQPLDYESIRRPGGRAAADDVIDWTSSTEDRKFSSTEDLKPSSTKDRKVSSTEDWKPNSSEDRKVSATEPESPSDTSAPSTVLDNHGHWTTAERSRAKLHWFAALHRGHLL